MAHPFYEQLNRVLEGRGFDEFVEQQCAQSMICGHLHIVLVPGLIGHYEFTAGT